MAEVIGKRRAGLTGSGQLTPPSAGVAASATQPPKVELSYRDTLAANVRLVAGRLPAGQAGSGATTVLQAAVTVATTRRFGLDVGLRLALPGTSLLLAVTTNRAAPQFVGAVLDRGPGRGGAPAGDRRTE